MILRIFTFWKPGPGFYEFYFGFILCLMGESHEVQFSRFWNFLTLFKVGWEGEVKERLMNFTIVG